MRAVSFAPLLIALASATADPIPVPVSAPAPAPTPAPAAVQVLPAAELARRVITTTIYTPTEWWDYSTTSISKDEYFLGIQSVTGVGGGLWYIHCINAPMTVSGGFAGCGYDDLYTSCSNTLLYGADGHAVRCSNGYKCVTNKIFENFASVSSSSFTPFLGCGTGTVSLELVRTPPASFESSVATKSGITVTQSTSFATPCSTCTRTSAAAHHNPFVPLCIGILSLVGASFGALLP